MLSVLPAVRSGVLPILPAGATSTPKFPVLGSGAPVIAAEFPLAGRGAGELSVEIILLAEQGAAGAVGRARVVFSRIFFHGIIFPGILAPVLLLGVGVRETPVVVVAGPGQRPGVSWAKGTDSKRVKTGLKEPKCQKF